MRRLFILLLCVSFVFTGCTNSRKIENAAVIESVSVTKQNGDIVYTFYKLTDRDKPDGTSVKASSFEKARKLAEEKYIPDMTLSKLELLMIDKSLDFSVLKNDIDYISTQASVSPVAYITLCDRAAIKTAADNKDACRRIESQIILCKNNYPEVNIDYLNVFNSLQDCRCLSFLIPLITGGENLKISTTNIAKN